jgi:hypothetical protein
MASLRVEMPLHADGGKVRESAAAAKKPIVTPRHTSRGDFIYTARKFREDEITPNWLEDCNEIA